MNDPQLRLTPFGLELGLTTEEGLKLLDGPVPTDAEGLQNYSSALWLKGRTEEALTLAQRAFELHRTVPTCINLAVILESLAQYDSALYYAYLAQQTDPTDERAVQCYGEHLLRHGRFKEGWPKYCFRRANANFALLSPQLPEWTDQVLLDRRILVVGYGGYGDHIYFLRSLAELRRRGAIITYLCDDNLRPLVRSLGFHVPYDLTQAVNPDDYDFYSTTYSLPMKLGWELGYPRWSEQYIHVGLLHRLKLGRGNIGLCWRAGELSSPRKSRELSVEQYSRVAWRIQSRLQDFTGRCYPTWLHTARALAKLSLLITVDTGVAHLAGAMHVPTWVILPGHAAWQYPIGHDYHPLYPTMRLFWSRSEGMEDAVQSCLEAMKCL